MDDLQRAIMEGFFESVAAGLSGDRERELRAIIRSQALLIISLTVMLPPHCKAVVKTSRDVAVAALEYLEAR